MTPEKMIQIMDRQGMSNQDIASISGVTYRQVMSWRSGQHPVPMMLSFLLLALDEGQLSADWLISNLEKELRNEA